MKSLDNFNTPLLSYYRVMNYDQRVVFVIIFGKQDYERLVS